jgi:AraC-like DNA-binding protein
MTGCGTTTYTDPDYYRVNVPGAAIDLVLTSGAEFKARVTWARMRDVTLVLVEETAPGISYISLTPALTHLAFTLRGEPVWNGIRPRRDDFLLQDGGRHLHQLTNASTRWGLISIRSKVLAAHGKNLLGTSLAPILGAQFVRPSRTTAAHVLRLHAQACRLAAAKPDVMTHREVARALEQNLVHALVDALSTAQPGTHNETMQRHAETIGRLEKALSETHARPSVPAICAALGVPQRTLRIWCEEFLGCGPFAYARLQQLNRARSALSKADHETESVASIASAHGFSEPGRFAVAYRALFGEAPSATLLRNSADSA